MSNILELLAVIFFGCSIIFFLLSLLTKDNENKRLIQGIHIGIAASGFVLLITSSLIDKV